MAHILDQLVLARGEGTMASLDYWSEAPLPRRQMALFSPTLDAMICPDDPVRLIDEILRGLDLTRN